MGATVSLDADADVQISTVRISYMFSTGTLEFERTVGQLLRTGDVDVPIENIVFEGSTAPGQRPPYHPAIRFADARLKALESIAGPKTPRF